MMGWIWTIPRSRTPPPLLHGPNGPATHSNFPYSILFGNGAGNPDATGMLPGRDPSLPYRGVFQNRSVGSAHVNSYTTISAQMDGAIFPADLLVT
jgi:hypothetical protein